MATYGATTKIEHGDHVREYGMDRVCRAPGCEVRLSRYNPDRVCGIHIQEDIGNLPRRR